MPLKEWTKKELRVVGLYGVAHRLWSHRPDVRTSLWNAGYRLAGAGDGLPIPPSRLMYLVDLSKEASWFLHTGRICYASIIHALEKNGYHPNDFHAILDFGCGCGRVLRYWQSLHGVDIYGTDYNSQLIHWDQKNLNRFAHFNINQLTPPLEYPNQTFDFIYSISVFTHLTEELQLAWMRELTRVLKPAGLLLITLHGESRLWQMDADERRRFLAGQVVIKQPGAVGGNMCASYHPRQYVTDVLARGLDFVDYLAEGARDADQDIYLLRKPAHAQAALHA